MIYPKLEPKSEKIQSEKWIPRIRNWSPAYAGQQDKYITYIRTKRAYVKFQKSYAATKALIGEYRDDPEIKEFLRETLKFTKKCMGEYENELWHIKDAWYDSNDEYLDWTIIDELDRNNKDLSPEEVVALI